MESMIRIQSNNLIISRLINHMNSEPFCHLVMIDLIALKTIILIRLSCKTMIYLIYRHCSHFIKESLKILDVALTKAVESIALL